MERGAASSALMRTYGARELHSGEEPKEARVDSSLIDGIGSAPPIVAQSVAVGPGSIPRPLLSDRVMRQNELHRAKEGDVYCPECGLHQPATHRYCIACGTWLPLELTEETPKVTQMFLGIPTHPSDPPAPVLRASHYLRDIEISSHEGSVHVPGHHARFSIWPDARPVCAMSLSDDETKRLGRFLLSAVPQEAVHELRS
jgi:hypothetical protein